jgi:hypothetical protein
MAHWLIRLSAYISVDNPLTTVVLSANARLFY